MKILLILLLIPLLTIPVVFGQVVETKGQNYDLTEDFNTGEASWTTHPDRIMMNDQWENYVLTNTNDKVIFNTNAVTTFIYDKASCSYSIYENGYDGANIIPSVSAVASFNNGGVWSNLSVNDQICTVEVSEYEDGVNITSTKLITENGVDVEKFVQELNLDIFSGFKETFKVWKSDGNQPLGISQTVHVGSEIVINDIVIPIAEYSGQSFDRQYIEDNEAEILQLTDKINYEFSTGILSLSNVNIIFDETSTIPYKVNLDYSSGNDGIPFVNYLEIDPTFTSTATSTVYAIKTSGGASTSCGTALEKLSGTYRNSYLRPSDEDEAGDCYITAFQVDTSSISDSATITDVDLTFDTGEIPGWGNLSGKECAVYDVTTDLTGSVSSAMLTDIISGTNYIGTGNTDCHSDSVTYDLGTQADTDLENNLGNDFFSMGLGWTDFARNSYNVGTGDMQDLVLAVTYTVPTVSTAPQSLNIDTQDVANEITLNWSAPSSNGGASITNYKIFIGGSLVATVGNVLTYDDTIAGAEIGASLAYTVKAVNSVGDSSASNSVSITSWGVPAQVGTVTGTAGANPALSWSAPSSDGTLTNYKIYRAGSLHDTISSSATTYSDSTSVVAGTTYAYTVSAVSAVGEGAQSASVNVLAGTPPNPVNSVSASITNTATAPLVVTVSFSPSSTTGTGTVTGFQLLRDGVAVSTAGSVTSMTNTVPAGGTEYSFTVITLGTHGNSVASSASAVTTPNTPAQVTGLSVTPISTSRIDLSWNTPNANNSLISGYKVQISSNGGSSWSDVLTGNVNTTYQSLSLTTNSQYHYKVSAINGVGTGTASAISNTYTMTPTPASLSATPVSEVQINLEWGASTGATGYKVEYESPTDNGFTTHTANTGNTDLTKSITLLTTATQYNFRVSGINAGGASVASPEASSYTWGILTAPTLDTITRLTSTSLKLDFTAGGGLPVATGYLIERQTGSGWIELIADTASTSLTFTDTVLSSDQTATYRLYAINDIGTSPVSNERTSDAIASSGGGGGSSNKAVSSQTGITGLIDLTFIDQIHRVILGEFLSKSINVAWDSSENIEVKSIIVSDSPFRIVFQDVPFVLIGDPSGISNGKINYSVQIPNELCTTQGQINCVEQRQYDIPVEIQTVHKSSTLTKSSVIKIDLAGGSDIPLVFVLLAIGAVPLAFIIRKIGSGKKKRKASGSSHKSSKNGSNTKKMSM